VEIKLPIATRERHLPENDRRSGLHQDRPARAGRRPPHDYQVVGGHACFSLNIIRERIGGPIPVKEQKATEEKIKEKAEATVRAGCEERRGLVA
jgi:hypothetical protein